jgi:uncharacterized protein YbjT (DUF2867 family)
MVSLEGGCWKSAQSSNSLAAYPTARSVLRGGRAAATSPPYPTITLAAAETLARLNPQMIFVYVSGAGTDSSEQGRSAWARVKGRTENAILRLPFKAAYMFRPGFIEPKAGIRSKTAFYRLLYTLARPVTPLLRLAFPNFILTTEQLGRAMIAVAQGVESKRILESRDILALSRITQLTDKRPS